MAQARVGLEQASMGQLPPVCICCGQPAARMVQHKFYFRPTWLIIARLFLGRLAWAFGTYRYVDLNVPVCGRHAGRLKLVDYIILYALLAWLLLGIVFGILGTVVGAAMGNGQLGGLGVCLFFLPLAPMLIGVMALQILTPRAEYFDYKIVHFTGVAPQFAQALGQGSPEMQYGAQQPQFSGPSPYKPYAGFALAPGAASRQGGMSPLVIGLIIAGVVVVGFMLVAGAGVVGLAILMRQTRPKEIANATMTQDHLSAPPGLGASPTRPGIQGGMRDLSPPGPGGPPDPFGGSGFPSGPPGIPPGSASKSPATEPSAKTGDTPPSNTPSSQPPGSAERFPGRPESPFGPNGGPRGQAASKLDETVFASPGAGGKATKFPVNSGEVTSGSQLVRGATVWGLDKIVWRKAEVLENGTAAGAKIHWVGWSSSWDEVLPFERLRLLDGAAVAAKTSDPATIPKGTTPAEDPAKEPPSTPEKPVAGGNVRTWTDLTGKFKIEAEYVSFSFEKAMVELKKTDGTTMSISLAKLCFDDRKYVIEQQSKRK